MVGWPYTTMTINSGGIDYTIEPLGTNLDDVVTAVNAAGAGVTATKVAVGGGEFRLQFTATKSGEAGKFTITTRHHLHRRQETRKMQRSHSGRAQLRRAGLKSATNTFTDLLPGVSITAKEVAPLP